MVILKALIGHPCGCVILQAIMGSLLNGYWRPVYCLGTWGTAGFDIIYIMVASSDNMVVVVMVEGQFYNVW